MGYLNDDLATRMHGDRPLRYVDIDDAELAEYPMLSEALAEPTGGYLWCWWAMRSSRPRASAST